MLFNFHMINKHVIHSVLYRKPVGGALCQIGYLIKRDGIRAAAPFRTMVHSTENRMVPRKKTFSLLKKMSRARASVADTH